ncbi:divalent metal cation transporter [Wukongibacter baidiensis]|uniref:NRAMP family divalent metal transporter n=1 Tax=Wukongibacter baidiensis TaxID=1723361 RepID=UPI003D7F30E6
MPRKSKIGPGLITAAVVVGPGSITVCTKLGATMGYSILWTIVISSIMMIIFTRIGTMIGIMSRESFLSTISRKYGFVVSLVIGGSVFFITTGFQIGNNIGVGLALETIFGGTTWLWALLFTVISLVFLWSSNSFYSLLEKLMTALVLIMVISFFGNLLIIRPSMGEILKGLIPSKPQSFGLVIAVSATTFSVAAASFQTYLVRSKGWTKKDISKGLKDSAIGIIILSIICMVIIITSAAVLKPVGITVNSAVEMAMQLEPLLGSFAKWMFLFGLWAGSFSSFIVNAMIGGTFLADGLSLGSSLDSLWAKIFASIIMILGTAATMLLGENPIQLLVITQATTIFGVPLIALFMMILANDYEVMGEYKSGFITNIIGSLAVLWLLYLSFRQFLAILA